jgi:hypothetical protein
MDIITALVQIIILATLVQFITDIVKGWLPATVLKIVTPLIISAIIGIGIALLLSIDLFTQAGYVVAYPIVSQIITGVILSAGSTAIHELIAKLRESRGGAQDEQIR